jgi:hypothetical protein
VHQFAIVCAGLASACLGVWALLAAVGGRDSAAARRIDLAGAATFGSLALAALVLLRMVVELSSRESGPLPVFVFLGVPLGLGLAWLTLRLGRDRRSVGGS